MNKAIFEIFRTGKHNGKNSKREWTAEDLRQTALLYSEAIRSAPLVIGHPADNLPEYGKVSRVIYCKNALFAEAEISPELVQKVKANQISGISASFIPLESENNPVKGIVYYLNHVGFLEEGKDRPAVKGMLPPEISVQNLYFNEPESHPILFCENDFLALSFSEKLHEKAQFFQKVLDVDYSQALEIATQ